MPAKLKSMFCINAQVDMGSAVDRAQIAVAKNRRAGVRVPRRGNVHVDDLAVLVDCT